MGGGKRNEKHKLGRPFSGHAVLFFSFVCLPLCNLLSIFRNRGINRIDILKETTLYILDILEMEVIP